MLFGEHGGQKVEFNPILSSLLLSPPLSPTARWPVGAPQWGLGRSLSRQRILEHSRVKIDRFDLLRGIFQLSKQLEIFRFLFY